MKWLSLTLIVPLAFLNAKAQKTVLPQSAKNDVRIDAQPPIEKPPMFPGGQKAFYKFLAENLKWPKSDDGDTQGRVIISFVVEKDGSLTGFKVERSLGKDFNAEALRVLKKSPKWIPAMKNGKPVRIKYAVPINFTLGA
jgi:protein TonB